MIHIGIFGHLELRKMLILHTLTQPLPPFMEGDRKEIRADSFYQLIMLKL